MSELGQGERGSYVRKMKPDLGCVCQDDTPQVTGVGPAIVNGGLLETYSGTKVRLCACTFV